MELLSLFIARRRWHLALRPDWKSASACWDISVSGEFDQHILTLIRFETNYNRAALPTLRNECPVVRQIIPHLCIFHASPNLHISLRSWHNSLVHYETRLSPASILPWLENSTGRVNAFFLALGPDFDVSEEVLNWETIVGHRSCIGTRILLI